MDDRLEALEQKVSELTGTVAALERRLAAVEAQGPAAARSAAVVRPADEDLDLGDLAPAEVTVVAVLSLIGRTCLVLGGAYLLRALTDAGTLPRAGGTLLGLAYAVAWLGAAYRLDATRQRLVAPFYGMATALTAFPLLWEATVRVKLLSPEWGAASVAGVTALALLVAWRRRIHSLAWIITVAGLLATLLFMAALGPSVPFGFYLAFLGIVTLWMGYTLDWIWLRWPVAFVADFAVVVMAATVTETWQRGGAGAVMMLQLALFGGYLVSIATRTLYRSRDVIPFEVVQTLALLVVAFGGAAYVMRSTGSGAVGLGVAALVFAVGSYGVALAFVDWREGHWKNFVFYNSLAVVFMLAGVGLTVGSSLQAVIWSGLAVASALLGHRYSAVALGSHSAVYVVAATLASGLLAHLSDAFTTSAAHGWAPLSVSAVVVLASAAACGAIPVSTARHSWGRYSRLPKVVIVVTLLLGAGGALIGLLVPMVAGQPGAGADPAIVAAIRTVVLGAAVFLLAWAGGRDVFAEGRWLMYVVLLLAGVKLLVEDFVSGRPSTLVLSLAVFGAALIIAPRWVRRGPS
jgi:hypothetical protein